MTHDREKDHDHHHRDGDRTAEANSRDAQNRREIVVEVEHLRQQQASHERTDEQREQQLPGERIDVIIVV